jgi:hypothetical protein
MTGINPATEGSAVRKAVAHLLLLWGIPMFAEGLMRHTLNNQARRRR